MFGISLDSFLLTNSVGPPGSSVLCTFHSCAYMWINISVGRKDIYKGQVRDDTIGKEESCTQYSTSSLQKDTFIDRQVNERKEAM